MIPTRLLRRLCVALPLLASLFTLSACVTPGATDGSDTAASVQIFDIRFTHQLPAGWKLGHEQQNSRVLLREYVPAGQSVHEWREMITLQVFRNLGQYPQAEPGAFVVRLAGLMQRSCEDQLVYQRLGQRRIGSVTGETAILGCRRMNRDSPSGLRRGQGELAVYLVFQAENHLLLLHRASRGPAFEATNAPIGPANAEELLKSMEPLRICRTDSPDCR